MPKILRAQQDDVVVTVRREGRPEPRESAFHNRGWLLAFAVALLVGIVLRLIWVQDIEYKLDEAWTFRQSQIAGRSAPVPMWGMPTSTGFANPGMSIWVFVGLARALAIDEPLGLARCVQWINIAALLLLAWFALRVVARREREPWLWAAALAAVNPLLVVVHRKIWPPSVLPLGSLLMLIGWWHRGAVLGAFAWGFVGACLGQIHMSGFFLAAAFALWALLFDRRSVRWRWWLAGSAVGSLTLLPWVQYLVSSHGIQAIGSSRWYRFVQPRFWVRWITDPLGLDLRYCLENDFGDFLRWPCIGGRPTYVVGALHGLVILIGIVLLGRTVVWLWRERGCWAERWIGRASPTAFTVSAGMWGFGLLLSFSTLPVLRHYLIVAFPLGLVWLARLALVPSSDERPPRLGRWLLATLCCAQLLMSVGFLTFIHRRDRIDGDYGYPYRAYSPAQLQELDDALRNGLK
jgi:hypothetical protein